MFLDLIETQTIFRANVNKSAQQIFVLWRYFAIYQVEPALDLRVQNRCVVVLEGEFGHHHCEQHNAQGPHICHFRVIQLASNHFRRSITRRSASRGQLLVRFVHIG